MNRYGTLFLFLALIATAALAACTTGGGTPAATASLPTLASTTQAPATATGTAVAATASATPETATAAAPAATPTATPVPGTALGPLQQIQMADAAHGWAIGTAATGTPAPVLWTEDGGQTWQARTPPQAAAGGVPGNTGPAARFTSATSGWVSYGGGAPVTSNDTFVVWRTTDAGQQWTASQPLPVVNMTMEFFAPSDLMVTADGFGWMLAHLGVGMSHDYVAVYTTADGGASWQRVSDPDSAPDIQACPKSALRFTSPTDAWLAANCPGLMPPLPFYHSADGGATWQQVTLPAPDAQAMSSASLGDQCGITQMETLATDTLILTLRCVDFQQNNSAQAWLYTTGDGGQSWQTAALPVPSLTFDFIDAGEGWLLGGADDRPGTSQHVDHTGNGGQSWQPLATVAAPGTPEFVDATHGWIVTTDGALLRSSDGGASWEMVAALLAP